MREPKRVYYKVLKELPNGRLVSYTTHASRYNVTYIPDVVTRPKVKSTKLFVFDNGVDAYDFASYGIIQGYAQVWSCAAAGVSKPPERICRYTDSATDLSAYWWEIHKGTSMAMLTALEQYQWTAPTPSGTVLCNSVRLLKRQRVLP